MSQKRGLDLDMILNAAAELAEEEGLEQVTLLQVAERLGVKSPSLYNHLSGLKALSAGIAKLAISRLEETVRSAAVGRSKADALREIAGAYRRFAQENPELYKAILTIPVHRDDDIRETGHAIVRILRQVMEPYQRGEEENIHFIRMFRSALHGFVSLEGAGFFKVEIDVDKSYERLVSGLISMLDGQRGV